MVVRNELLLIIYFFKCTFFIRLYLSINLRCTHVINWYDITIFLLFLEFLFFFPFIVNQSSFVVCSLEICSLEICSFACRKMKWCIIWSWAERQQLLLTKESVSTKCLAFLTVLPGNGLHFSQPLVWRREQLDRERVSTGRLGLPQVEISSIYKPSGWSMGQRYIPQRS